MTSAFRIALSGAAAMAVTAGIWIAVARVGAGTAASPHGSLLSSAAVSS